MKRNQAVQDGIITIKREGKKYQEHEKLLPELETVLRTSAEGLEHQGTITADSEGRLIVAADNEHNLLLNEVLFTNTSLYVQLKPRDNPADITGNVLRELCLLKIRRDHLRLHTKGEHDKPSSVHIDEEKHLRYSTSERSPFINNVIYRLFHHIWKVMNTDTKVHSSIAQSLLGDKRRWEEAGENWEDFGRFCPKEFYQLLADILYHLPIVLDV